MTAVSDVPDVAWQKVTVSAWHRGFLEASFRWEKGVSKPLKDAFYAIFSCEINNFSWSDPSLTDYVAFPIDVIVFDPLTRSFSQQRFDAATLASAAEWWQQCLRAALGEFPMDWAKSLLSNVSATKSD